MELPKLERRIPTPLEVQRAERRIHAALDKNQAPSPPDVEMIGGTAALKTLISSRSLVKEEIKEAVKEEVREPVKLKITGEASGSSTTEDPQQPPKPRKLTKDEQDYKDFVSKRIGPMMVLFLFFFLRDWAKATFYAFSPDECEKMSGPISHIGPRIEKLFRFPGWVHAVIVTSDDTVTLLFVMAGYLERTGMLDKLIPLTSIMTKETKKKHESTQKAQPVGSVGSVQQNGYGPVDLRAIGIGSQYITDL
jgi:hypothetical protein